MGCRLHDDIRENLNTENITEILNEVANPGDCLTFISLKADSQTVFTLDDLKKDNEDDEDMMISQMIHHIETKNDNDSLIYILDDNLNIQKFII